MRRPNSVFLVISSLSFGQLLAIETQAANLFSEAMDHYEAADYEKAIAALEEFVAGEPKGSKAAYALYLLGDASATLGREADAIRAFQRCGNDYASSEWAASAVFRLAELHRSREEWEKAAGAYALFIELYLRNSGDNVGGSPVSQAVERIIECHQQIQPARSRQQIQRNLLGQYEGGPVGDAVLLAGGGELLPPGSNLLLNPGFELDREALRLPPLGWEYRGTEPRTDNDADGTLNGSVFDGTAEPRSGRFAAGKFTSYGVHQGWIFQIVPASPGKRYECSVYCMVKGQEGSTGRMRLGIDPKGGRDPRSGLVRWTEYAAPFAAYERIGFLGQDAVAAVSDRLTLYLEIYQDIPFPDNVMLFDDAEVRLVDEEQR